MGQAVNRVDSTRINIVKPSPPALAFYVVFVLIPAVGGVWYSLTSWNGLNPTYRFVGLRNYAEALTEDLYFMNSVLFTRKYVLSMVVLQNTLALGLAVIVESLQRKPIDQCRRIVFSFR